MKKKNNNKNYEGHFKTVIKRIKKSKNSKLDDFNIEKGIETDEIDKIEAN